MDQILLLAVTIDAEDFDTSTALAAASFGSTKLFHFAQGSLKVAGSAVVAVLNATVQGNTNLKGDRYVPTATDPIAEHVVVGSDGRFSRRDAKRPASAPSASCVVEVQRPTFSIEP